MKYFTILGLVLLFFTCLLPISASSPTQALERDTPLGMGELRPAYSNASNPNHTGDSPIPPLTIDDSHFVADVGGHLDQYLFRKNVLNGRLIFSINIDRYYSPLITPTSVDAKGLLMPAVYQDLIDRHLLPERATLFLEVWDVDHDASDCSEVDHVYINGQLVKNVAGTAPATLTSGNETWSQWSVQFPTAMLKFPTARGTNGNRPTPGVNEIAVDINIQQCTVPNNPSESRWAVEVDWGAIEISSPIRPIIFAHGWTGNVNTFDAFVGFAQNDGIITAGQPNLLRGIQPIVQTSPILETAILRATKEFGVDKVNIFGHSKGGLVARQALLTVAKKVDAVITFGSPHHGTDFMGLAAYHNCSESKFPNQADRDDCDEAARELRVDDIRENFNYIGCTKGSWPWSSWTGCQPRAVSLAKSGVNYRSLAGNRLNQDVGTLAATYPWRADAVPYPENGNVDAVLELPHWTIHTAENSYRCAISFIDSNIHGRDNCPTSVTGSGMGDPTNAPRIADEEYQAVSRTTGSLLSGNNTTLMTTIDTVEETEFNVFTSNSLATFTLEDPQGKTVTPSTGGISYIVLQEEGWWRYQYIIKTPVAGVWKLKLNALDKIDYSSSVRVKSTIRLFIKTNKFTYNRNELVMIEAALANNDTPLPGSTITMIVTRPDGSTVNLNLVDNGGNGDIAANNGVYTAQFDSSAVTGYHQLSLNASNGQISRLVDTSIAVAAKTAQIQSVTNATPLDTNANGLIDELKLNLSLNVSVAGNFEISGNLIDSNGNPVASASYSTLSAGSGPLPTGIQSIALTFDGAAIREYGASGPFRLTNVVANDLTASSLQVSSAQNLYTTNSYNANQFEGPLLTLRSGSEAPLDNNGNGQYDVLNIVLMLDVINPGTYELNGRLVDRNGNELGWSLASFTAQSSGLHQVQIEFDGRAIGEHQVDGPYTLQDLSIYNVTGVGNRIIDQAYSTKAYSFTEFEGGFSTVGDCNGDRAIGAADITALALEFFDGDDNNSAAATPGGTYPGTPACDANGDNRIGASDITCIARIFFNGAGTCNQEAATAATSNPVLVLPDQMAAMPDSRVTVPIHLQTNDSDVSSLLFSLDYDETLLHFDPTDSNQDGIPDSVVFDVPTQFIKSVAFDPTDPDGELDIMLADFAAPPGALPADALLEVTLHTGSPASATAAAIKFSQTPGPSFGNRAGRDVAGITDDGSILIMGVNDIANAKPTLYLPLIVQK